MMKAYGILAAAVIVLSNAGCGMFGPLVQTGKGSVFRNATVKPIDYKAVATIGADETSPTLRMSVIVRERLKEQGIEAVRRAGRWSTEEEAVRGICRSEEVPKVQGVVIVSYDTLVLRECTNLDVAFRVMGNGQWSLSQLADELAKFIKSSQAAAQGTPSQP